mmetsp:Transcript_5316/g.13484  ORF Transcript_5316/g.13484 Transcript_5316/m.13484 type:complete len:210 (+) Transcript_5316:460-1089(+)
MLCSPGGSSSCSSSRRAQRQTLTTPRRRRCWWRRGAASARCWRRTRGTSARCATGPPRCAPAPSWWTPATRRPRRSCTAPRWISTRRCWRSSPSWCRRSRAAASRLCRWRCANLRATRSASPCWRMPCTPWRQPWQSGRMISTLEMRSGRPTACWARGAGDEESLRGSLRRCGGSPGQSVRGGMGWGGPPPACDPPPHPRLPRGDAAAA